MKHNDQMPRAAERDENERLNVRFGPFFTRARVKQLLNIPDAELDRLVTAHHLLAPVTADGVQVFPKFQVDTEQKQPREHLRPLLEILLGSGVDAWTVTYWLTAPLPEFEHLRVIDVIDRDAGEFFVALEHDCWPFGFACGCFDAPNALPTKPCI